MRIDWSKMRDEFLLDPKEIYLNAGTYSALPRAVCEAQHRIMIEAEGNPTRRAARNKNRPAWRVQKMMARYLGVNPEDFVFHVNVTQAMNQAIFSYPWPKGGEFLSTDLEYGAIANAAREASKRRGMSFRVIAIPLFPRTEDEIVDAVLREVGPKTAGMLLSHVTSSTGMRLPVERLAVELRKRDVRSVIDGAHAPGLVPVKLGRTEIDFYGGNLHKWFMGPKGTGFLYANRRYHQILQPHVVGWGGVETDPKKFTVFETKGTSWPFQYVFQFQGLHDVSPVLALEETLRFRRRIGEANIRRRVAELKAYVERRFGDEMGLRVLSPAPQFSAGLTSFEVPGEFPPRGLEEAIFRASGICVAAWKLGPGKSCMRVSAGIWNTEAEIDRLVYTLKRLMR